MTAGLKRILIAPDSFKGSLSASEAAAAMRLGILRVLPQADIVCSRWRTAARALWTASLPR